MKFRIFGFCVLCFLYGSSVNTHTHTHTQQTAYYFNALGRLIAVDSDAVRSELFLEMI